MAEIIEPAYCLNCVHWRGIEDGRLTCAAFADIPDEIVLGDFDHRNEWPGDDGVRFEAVDAAGLMPGQTPEGLLDDE